VIVIDALADCQFPSLNKLLDEYLGAVTMQANGLVTAEYVAIKLKRLANTCRAANTVMAYIAVPELKRVRALLAPKSN
jgi:hypothetical protein